MIVGNKNNHLLPLNHSITRGMEFAIDSYGWGQTFDRDGKDRVVYSWKICEKVIFDAY